MSKPILMIHEFKEEFLSLPLRDYILTFDDGLYSQYFFWSELSKIPTEKIFFISSNIICDTIQSVQFPTCRLAHEKAFLGNKEDYMNLSQIQELMVCEGVEIGGHSHYHKRLNNFTSLHEKVEHIKQDTEKMLAWFKRNLDYTPTSFCFPYNENLDGMYNGLLKKYGFTKFYGKERIAIESLLPNLFVSS